MELGLSGRIALVTGGGRGIGRAVALALANEGADVAVLARTASEVERTAQEVGALGRKALALTADVASLGALDDAITRIRTQLGGAPTLLILGTAALWTARKLQFVSDAEAAAQLQVDLGSAVALCSRALPGMMEARFGRIVALSSMAAQVGISGGTLYSAAKAGLEGLMRGLAVDYSRRGITANAVALGFVDTERLALRLKEEPGGRARLERATARRTLVTPEEAAAAVVFLCSKQAAAITGTVLPVTAGAHLATEV